MDIRNKKIAEGEFMALRQEVLAQWPTGKDVNLQEAVDYHKSMPEYRNFGKKLLDAKAAGRTLVQPRAGVPVVEEHIKLMQYLEKYGEADLLPSTIDSYTTGTPARGCTRVRPAALASSSFLLKLRHSGIDLW